MVTIKFLKKDPRVLEKKNYCYVGKECVIAEWMAHGMVRTAKRNSPDALASLEIDFTPPFPRYNGEKLTDEKILVYRNGGAGDLIMLTPAIMKIKKMYPNAEFHIITQEKFHSLAKLLPPFSHARAFPLLKSTAPYDYYISFAGSIENPTKEARSMAGIDLFAKHARVGLEDEEKTFLFHTNRSQKKRINKLLSKKVKDSSGKVIVIQFRPSNMNRAFDVYKMASVIRILSELKDTNIFLVGGDKKECQFNWHIDNKPHPRIHKVLGKLSWGETIELVKRADLCIGSDSALVHIAGMQSIPCISLFGPIPWELRVGYYENRYPIWVDYPCAPCFSHGDGACTPLVESIKEYEKEHKKSPAWMAAPCWGSVGEEEVVATALDILYPGGDPVI